MVSELENWLLSGNRRFETIAEQKMMLWLNENELGLNAMVDGIMFLR